MVLSYRLESEATYEQRRKLGGKNQVHCWSSLLEGEEDKRIKL